MSDKSLKFQFVLDENSFNRVKSAIDELIKKSQVLAKSLQGVSLPGTGILGGGTVGTSGSASSTIAQGGAKAQSQLGKVVLDNAAAFKNMANLGTGALKGLTDALKNSVETQRRQIEGLKGALDALGRTYDNLGGKGKNAAAVQAKMLQISGQITAGQGNLASLQNLMPHQSLLPNVPPPPDQSRWQQFRAMPLGQQFTTQLGPGGVGPGGIAQWAMGGSMGAIAMRSAGLIGAGVAAVGNTSQAFNNMMIDTRASRGAAVRPAFDRMKRGDVSDALAEKTMSKMTRQEQIEAMRSVGSTETEISAMFGAGWAALSSGGKDMAALTPDELNTKKYGRYQEMLDKIKSSTEHYAGVGRGYEYANETRGSRMTATRMLGVGVRGGKDSYTPLASRLHEQGFSIEELAGASAQAKNSAGRQFAGQYAGAIMSANAGGYGQVGDVLAAAARSSGNARLATQYALGGGVDTAAGLQLGSSLYGFDPRGTVSGMGALKAIQAGFSFDGSAGDFNQVARAQLGMQSADRLSAGIDGYGQGMNLVSAVGALPGGTTYAQDSLAGRMGFKELAEIASGGSSSRATAYGITQGAASTQLGGMAHGLFSRYVEQGGTDSVSKTMRAMAASGLSETDYLSQLGSAAKERVKGKGGKLAMTDAARAAQTSLESLGVWASDAMGGDTEGGIGMIQALSGVKGLDKAILKSGAIPGAGIDDVEKAQRKTEAEQMQESGKALMGNLTEIIDALGKNKERLLGTENFGKFAVEIDRLTEKFRALSGVIPEATGDGSTTAAAMGLTSSNQKAAPFFTSRPFAELPSIKKK